MSTTDADLAEWTKIQPPAFSGAPSPEQQALAGELGTKRKELLKKLAKQYAMTEKKVEKELKKKMSKANAKSKPKAPKVDKKSEDIAAVQKTELPEPKDNLGRGAYHVNTPELLAAHLKRTGGVWQTRFPPEPNGYLHIGHAKAMGFNFGQATSHPGGNCYLRFDDTNPTAEKQEYIDSILASVKWLGHTPFKVTATSDYFQELFDFAVELIKRGKAYVCHQNADEVTASRDLLRKFHGVKEEDKAKRAADCALPDGAASPWRDRPVEENLCEFEEMKCGIWDEGTSTLRMKMDLHSPNPNMWDHMAYRVMFHAHPHSKDKWCIYPTYDYSHCLVDSLEDVTHSMCTLEFQTRQAPDASYHWLNDALGLFHSWTWEYSRCSISRNVMSKRRLNMLVTGGTCDGWDDPRLLTLDGLRRRGYTAKAINHFCGKTGVARGGTVCLPKELLEACIREELDQDASRAFAVLKPLAVTIVNHPGGALPIQAPNHPGKGMEHKGKRDLYFTPTVYIESADFKEVDEDGYFGLAPGKSVRLLFAFNITCVGVDKDAEGNVTAIRVEYDPDMKAALPKGKISWVGNTAAKPVQVRMYDDLFVDCGVEKGGGVVVDTNAEEAAKVKGCDFLDLLNPHSCDYMDTALVEPSVYDTIQKALAKSGKAKLYHATPELRWQFTRVGYFVLDLKTSTAARPVLNKIVSLRESSSKGKGKAKAKGKKGK